MRGESLLQHPQLHEVLFAYVEDDAIIGYRLLSGAIGSIVLHSAGTALRDALKYLPTTNPSEEQRTKPHLHYSLLSVLDTEDHLSSLIERIEVLSLDISMLAGPRFEKARAMRRLVKQYSKKATNRSPQPLRVLNIQGTCGIVDCSDLERVFRTSPMLEELDVRDASGLEVLLDLYPVSRHCQQLRRFRASDSGQLDPGVESVLKQLHPDEQFEVIGISPRDVEGVLESNPSLEILELVGDRQPECVDDQVVLAVSQAASKGNLRHLALTVPDSWNVGVRARLIDALMSCFKLEHLHLSGELDASWVLDLPNLQFLKVESLEGIGKRLNAGFAAVRPLTSFSVVSLEESELLMILESCPRLEAIDVDEVTNSEFLWPEAIARCCPRIREVSVDSYAWECNGHIRSHGFEVLVSTCRNLTVLRTSLPTRDASVGADVLRSLATHGKQLEALRLSHLSADNFDDELIAVLKNCRNLKELMLPNCSDLTNSTVEAIAGHCPLLEKLDVSTAHKGLADRSLVTVFQRCRYLKEINISRSGDGITDDTIMAIAANCRYLESLSTDQTTKVTNAAVSQLGGKCRSLRYVVVTDTDGGVTRDAFTAALPRWPALIHIFVDDTIDDEGLEWTVATAR